MDEERGEGGEREREKKEREREKEEVGSYRYLFEWNQQKKSDSVAHHSFLIPPLLLQELKMTRQHVLKRAEKALQKEKRLREGWCCDHGQREGSSERRR